MHIILSNICDIIAVFCFKCYSFAMWYFTTEVK